MCKSNINIIANLYKNYTDENNIKTFEAPFDTIIATKEEGMSYIENFFIVIDYRILGTSDEKKKNDNVLINKKNLKIKLRLYKLSSDPSKQYFTDLTETNVDLGSDDIHISHACVDYVSLRQLLKVKRINLEDKIGLGNFVLKILIKTEEEEQWTVQSLTPLRIE